ncbi:MAG: WYL domain-containing protein [Anaerolineae bacterium]|nr:WYL domain-containing protein [Anaerolineae bacterium]
MSKTIDTEELIRLYTQPGNGYSDQELADRLGVGRDAVFRRRQKLEQDYPFIQTGYGRYKIDREKFISHVGVNQYEALVLYLATRRLSRNTRLAKRHVQNALEKLALALYKPMTERLVKAAAAVPDHPDAARRQAILEELVRGWAEQLKVHIRYRGLTSDKATNHTISPYLIEPSPWSDSVYVVAKTNVWDGMTPFQLERIKKATLSTEPFEIERDFAEETLFKYAWGIWSSDKEPSPVKLRFTGREAMRRVQESVWHPEQKLEPQPDGSLVWSAPIAEWKEMLPWIRGWGSDVEVLEPVELREMMMGEARRLAELYGWRAAKVSAKGPETSSLSQTFSDFFGD